MAIFFLLIFSSNLVFAESKDIKYYYDNLDSEKEKFLNNIEELPSILQRIIKNDKIKVEIETEKERLELFLEKTKEGTYNLTKENIDKVNVWIYSKEETINKILESQEPITELTTAIKNKDITIKTQGFFRSIKFKIAKLFLNFKK